MRAILGQFIRAIIMEYPGIRKMLSMLLPRNLTIRKMILQSTYLEQVIRNHYPAESIAERRFYNIGAGFQRSRYDFWSYLDLKSDAYDQRGIDLFFDLEALEPLPLPDNHAELIFNSFVVEHISKEATENLCREAFRSLKQGGVFHSKIHSYDYGIKLLEHKLISPKIPFEERESRDKVNAFIKKHKGKVASSFRGDAYVIASKNNPDDYISFSPADAFIYHNATAARDNLLSSFDSLDVGIEELGVNSSKEFYQNLRAEYVDHDLKQPYQHNADYFSPEDLKSFLESLGFSEVYFTQPYQSVSPALWEDKLNPLHYGFLFSIEAVK